MRIVFAGTPEFAVPTLQALHASRHEVVAVYTQPDRPAGRGQRLKPSAVKQAALALGLNVEQAAHFKTEQSVHALRAHGADAMVVVAYGLLLPQTVLDVFAADCWNLHASLLPRWRGAAPIARAIEAGDSLTAVAVMKMERGLDTGPILTQAQVPISPEDNAQSLQDRLARLGASLMSEAMDRVAAMFGRPLALEQALQPQSMQGITYANKLSKAEAQLNFAQSAGAIERKLRAFDPVPGCFTWVHQALSGATPAMIKCWRGRAHEAGFAPRKPADESSRAGRIVGFGADGPVIACAKDWLELIEVQPAGGVRLPAMRWARQIGLQVGDFFADQTWPGEPISLSRH